jgi:hypothetical protein
MKTYKELVAWHLQALQTFADPAEPVCQMFFRFVRHDQAQQALRTGDLICWMDGPELMLQISSDEALPLPIKIGRCELAEDHVQRYGSQRVTHGVYAISPSLNIQGLVHGFLVLYDVPEPTPWEQLIILVA